MKIANLQARVVSVLTIASFLAPMLAVPRRAGAVMNGFGNASNVNPGSIKAAPPACSDICPMLVGGGNFSGGGQNSFNSNPNGKCNGTNINSASDVTNDMLNGSNNCVNGLNGGTWSNDDDTSCASRGFPTSVSATPTATPTPVSSGSAQKCNVPIMPEDGGSCDAANQKALKCMFHGSQLEAQCLAYMAASQGKDFDEVLAILDIAVAAVCAAACLTKALGDAGATACQVGGMLVGAVELIDTLVQHNGTIGTTIGALASGVGIGVEVANVAGAGANTAGLGMDPNHGATDSNSASNTEQKEDCVAAIAFAVLAGVRIYNIISMGSSKDDACKEVQKLWSSAASQNTSNTSPNPAQYTFNPQTGQVNSGGPSQGSGGNTSTGSTPGQSGMPCLASGGGLTACGGTPPGGNPGGAATDSGFLTRTGMDKTAGPLAAKLDASGIRDKFKDGAGAAMASAMPASAGDFGAGLAKLAQQSQEHATELGIGGVSATTMSGGGGGGGGKGAGGDAANPFANLFGAKDAAAPVGGAKADQFGSRKPANDIWHTGTTMNLFEIVSGKLGVVSNRVGSR